MVWCGVGGRLSLSSRRGTEKDSGFGEAWDRPAGAAYPCLFHWPIGRFTVRKAWTHYVLWYLHVEGDKASTNTAKSNSWDETTFD